MGMRPCVFDGAKSPSGNPEESVLDGRFDVRAGREDGDSPRPTDEMIDDGRTISAPAPISGKIAIFLLVESD